MNERNTSLAPGRIPFGGRLTPFLLAAALSMGIGAAAGPGPSTASPDRLFTLKVLPLLKEKCFACHGDDPKKIKGEFNMLTRERLLKGGESGATALVPGDAEPRPMFVAVTWEDEDFDMPPK
jgi:hypothetical protein